MRTLKQLSPYFLVCSVLLGCRVNSPQVKGLGFDVEGSLDYCVEKAERILSKIPEGAVFSTCDRGRRYRVAVCPRERLDERVLARNALVPL